jgi:aminoglycoside phosphotransferase (APT) family kinase protein
VSTTPGGQPDSAPDPARLAAFIRARIEPFDGELGVRKVEGGQSNPTFIVDAGARRYVLRRKPAGAILPSAHAVEREYRALKALDGSAVPVPRARVLCEDPQVLGSAFYLMDFVDGRIMSDQTLPGMTPALRRAHYAELNRVMAALHGVDYPAIGLGDYGREERYVERQIERWTKQYRGAETRRIDAMESLLAWLPAHVPPQAGTSIVHGDFRLDNLIFHATEPRIVAVLDWELSTLGDPLVDFAYHCLSWRLGLGVNRTLVGMSDAELGALGIPTEAEHVAAYCSRTGRGEAGRIAHWAFYLAFNMFRLAAIQQGIARRALDGNAANSRALEVAARVEATAQAGWSLARQL